MRSLPSRSLDSLAARLIESAYRARPDMYISLLGSSPRVTSTGNVFVILTPKARPFSSQRAINLFSIGIASTYCRSSSKWNLPNTR